MQNNQLLTKRYRTTLISRKAESSNCEHLWLWQVYNKHSRDMEMVKAVLCAGLYPQVAMCKIRNARFALFTRDEGRVEPDPSSLITGVHNLPLPWLVYTEVVRGTCYIRDLTNVSNYMVLMFGGHLVCNNKNASSAEMLGGFLHFSASKRATTIVRVCFHNPPHIAMYWLCLGGRDLRVSLQWVKVWRPVIYGVSNSLFK